MKKRIVAVLFFVAWMPMATFGIDAGDGGGAGGLLGDVKDGLTAEQKKIVDAAAKAQNLKASQLANSIISEPLSAKEAGCLDQIMGVDLSVFKVNGVGSIWDAAYNMVMNQIKNLSCSAVSDWAKDQTGRVDDLLSNGIDMDEMGDIWSGGATDPKTPPDVSEYVGTSGMGKVPPPPGSSGSKGGMQYQDHGPGPNYRELSDKMDEMVEKNIFWGGSK